MKKKPVKKSRIKRAVDKIPAVKAVRKVSAAAGRATAGVTKKSVKKALLQRPPYQRDLQTGLARAMSAPKKKTPVKKSKPNIGKAYYGPKYKENKKK